MSLIDKIKPYAKQIGLVLALGTMLGCASAKKTTNIISSQPKKTLVQQINEEIDYSKNIGDIFLDIEKCKGTTEHDYKLLDSLANSVKEKVELKEKYSEQDALHILRSIDQTIKDYGFSDGSGVVLTSDSFKDRIIDCRGYSMLFVSIGEKLNLPLHAVLAPKHVFVRWDEDGEHDGVNERNPVNKRDINWDGPMRLPLPDKYYSSFYDIDSVSVTKGAYLKSLNRKELAGQAFANRGHVAKGIRFDDFAKSLELNPNNVTSLGNCAVILADEEKYKESLKYTNKVLDLAPNNKQMMNLQAYNLLRLGKHKNSKQLCDKILEKDPKNSRAYYTRSECHFKEGNFVKSAKDYISYILN